MFGKREQQVDRLSPFHRGFSEMTQADKMENALVGGFRGPAQCGQHLHGLCANGGNGIGETGNQGSSAFLCSHHPQRRDGLLADFGGRVPEGLGQPLQCLVVLPHRYHPQRRQADIEIGVGQRRQNGGHRFGIARGTEAIDRFDSPLRFLSLRFGTRKPLHVLMMSAKYDNSLSHFYDATRVNSPKRHDTYENGFVSQKPVATVYDRRPFPISNLKF
jgi:hypothetical protein